MVPTSGSKREHNLAMIKGLKEARDRDPESFYDATKDINFLSIFSSVKKYHLKAEEDKIDEITEMLRTEGVGPGSLNKKIAVTNYYLTNDNTVEVLLNREQATELKAISGVLNVSLVHKPTLYPTQVIKGNSYCLQSECLSSHGNWGLTRLNYLSSNFWSSADREYNYTLTGSGVDIIVFDSGIDPNHPEWISSQTGQTRFVPYNWSLLEPLTSSNNITVSVVDGKFALNDSKQATWYIWDTPSDKNTIVYNFNLDSSCVGHPFFIRLNEFDGNTYPTYVSRNNSDTGTITLTAKFSKNINSNSSISNGQPFVYSCGNHLNMGGSFYFTTYNTMASSYYRDTNGHGTHCAGIAAGYTFGVAKEASIYSIKSITDDADATDILTGLDYIKKFHEHKQTVSSLSSRPTVVTHSWGYIYTALPASYKEIYIPYQNPTVKFASGWATVYYEGASVPSADESFRSLSRAGIHNVIAAGNNSNRIVSPEETELYNYKFYWPGTDDDINCFRKGSPGWPASYNNEINQLIIVGALDAYKNHKLTFSSWLGLSSVSDYIKQDYPQYSFFDKFPDASSSLSDSYNNFIDYKSFVPQRYYLPQTYQNGGLKQPYRCGYHSGSPNECTLTISPDYSYTNVKIPLSSYPQFCVNDYDQVALYSNYGTAVDIYAPGTNIKSSSPSLTSTIGNSYGRTLYSTGAGLTGYSVIISGTSMATPHVAGMLALHLQKFPYLSPLSAKNQILLNSVINNIADSYHDYVINNTNIGNSTNNYTSKYDESFSDMLTLYGITDNTYANFETSNKNYLSAGMAGIFIKNGQSVMGGKAKTLHKYPADTLILSADKGAFFEHLGYTYQKVRTTNYKSLSGCLLRGYSHNL